ncbi:DNA-binding protein H-NS [Litoreibacter halocynthiae]|uniref:DNA-binding protein H-NS n=1 Tax=Litoreibacter halocynthiae TaxID=1242689 RepID=A0A4R7LB42_9RHOB|nr:H-NS histone family protein [Litoreibacter halocynthiae]TDT72678.1 DNA-binding protein H-NS [Litoreibacter halocynthiae]
MAKIDLKGLSLTELKALNARVAKAIERHDKGERNKALAAIQAKAKSLGFSLDELTGGGAGKAAKPTRKKRAPAKVTHRHPDDKTLTWVGLGARPKWLKDAIASGRSLDEFKI